MTEILREFPRREWADLEQPFHDQLRFYRLEARRRRRRFLLSMATIVGGSLLLWGVIIWLAAVAAPKL